MGDLLEALGNVSPDRVFVDPPPGMATEAHLLELLERDKVTCELVDGTLVEKPVGIVESLLASALIRLLGNYVMEHHLGVVTAPDGPFRLRFGLVRLPDVAFIPWDRLPSSLSDLPAIPSLVPALAIEVLSDSNTRREMELKCEEYFRAGVRLVWIVDPRSLRIEVYREAQTPDQVLQAGDTIDGADVLPGFTLGVDALFSYLNPPRPPTTAGQHE